jgi:hypothetical protein
MLGFVSRVQSLVRLEWAIYGRRVRVAAVTGAVFIALVGFEIVEALLPHHVQNTFLRYQEKSNGAREFFGTGVREVQPRRHGR